MATDDRLHRIETLLSDLRAEFAETRTNTEHVLHHLAKLNGRTEKSEDRIGRLERLVSELKGAWRLITLTASAIGALAAWAIQHLVKP